MGGVSSLASAGGGRVLASEERACNSTKVELYNTEIKVGEVLSSVQPEVLEPSYIVLVQQISKLLGRLKLYNCVPLCLFEKGVQLVVFFSEDGQDEYPFQGHPS